MKTINFSYNWNNKLECKAYTTLRLENPSKYKVGEVYDVTLKDEVLHTATIVDIKILRLDQLNDYIAYLDTGYNLDECRNIIKRMYSKVDFSTKKLAFILLRKQEFLNEK
ncbi:hypothetical protein EI546_06440 [Aequorivita sp. H23M31]|uniref:ASCH domain-containing protein n=1 Tax=Aequorivita ciconiae TaxID=2494375 RepID=A0A410G278_9FLAO|nr:ASCH domain-containing protein [Aequorivita sp. H23M31]QAA81388.1 hypothetical protein EI546_06440 [Aequorivita sp. H23M31]